MKEKNKKKQIAKISVFITSIFVIFMSITYAFVTQTLNGNKKVVVSAGVSDLELEEENAITISDALPMHDEVGMIQEDAFVFRLVNKTANPTNYNMRLAKIETSDELDESIVKYGLIKEEEKTIDLLSNLSNGLIDSGTIEGNDIIDYELRLWIDSTVTDDSLLKGRSLSYKLEIEAGQITVQKNNVLDNTWPVSWNSTEVASNTVRFTVDTMAMVKISNLTPSKEDLSTQTISATLDGEVIQLRPATLQETEGIVISLYVDSNTQMLMVIISTTVTGYISGLEVNIPETGLYALDYEAMREEVMNIDFEFIEYEDPYINLPVTFTMKDIILNSAFDMPFGTSSMKFSRIATQELTYEQFCNLKITSTQIQGEMTLGSSSDASEKGNYGARFDGGGGLILYYIIDYTLFNSATGANASSNGLYVSYLENDYTYTISLNSD